MRKKRNWVIAGCAVCLALVCFGLSAILQGETPENIKTPTSTAADTEQNEAVRIDPAVSSPTEASSAAPVPKPAPAPPQKAGGVGQNPQYNSQNGRGNTGQQNPAGQAADHTPAPATQAPAAPAPAVPAANTPPEPNSVATPPAQPAPTPAPAPAPEPELAPVAQPTPPPTPAPAPTPPPEEQAKPGGYAYCSCGAVLSETDLVAHMKQHALNGESHHYDTY